MSYKNSLETISLPAAADLSAAQYKCITVNSSGQAALANATTLVVGVLQDKPAAAGRPANIGYTGVSKALLGATVTAGARVTSDANGAVIAATTAGDAVLGVALVGGSAGDIISVLINPYPFAALA